MVIQEGKYKIEIEEDSISVLPLSRYCRVKGTQRATFAEVYSLEPQYVRLAVARKLRYIGIIYLIHFDTPYKHAKHYLGFTNNIDKRLLRHSAGRGSRLMQVVEQNGITWQLARLWYGDRYEERRLKKHSSTRYCPFCNSTVREEAA